MTFWYKLLVYMLWALGMIFLWVLFAILVKLWIEIIKTWKKIFRLGVCKKCDKLGYLCKTHTKTEITRRCAIKGLEYCLKNIKTQKSWRSMECSETHKGIVKVSVEIIEE